VLSITMTMGEALQAATEARPDQEVFVCGETRMTNRQLRAEVDSATRGLFARGIRKADRVAAQLPPGQEFVKLFFAAARLGAVFVPLSPDLREGTLASILADCEPRLVIRPGEPLPPAPADLSPAAVDPGDLLALLYTSGTTGTPKATMHTHRSLIAPVVATVKVRELWTRPSSLRIAAQAVKAFSRYGPRLLRAMGKPQTILSTTGWHTITGLHVMLQGLLMGDRLAVLPRFHPQHALQLVQRERVTVLIAVPTAWQAMVAMPDLDRYDTSSLIVCGAGGAASPPSLAREIQRRFKCAFYNGFGMTEMGGGVSVSSLADSDARQAETVGKPMPGVEMRVVDEQRRERTPGEVGELAVRGPGVMSGYYRAPELTAQVLDKDGWLYTGDMARIDQKGYIHVVGRKKDLIIRGGQNIYPAEIENHLASHPRIAEAAVVGVPAAVGGESVWAFIRLKNNEAMSVREVLDHCRGVLEIHKIPSEVRFLEEFPRGETGKPQKFELRAAAIRERSGGAT
jgi:acyl-CoA synthetase (AMP-forming)/AMP-acid ligase II